MPSRRAVIVSSCEPCASATSKSRPRAHFRSAPSRCVICRAFCTRERPPCRPTTRRLQPVQLEQLERLRVVARGDLAPRRRARAGSRSAAGRPARARGAVMSIQTLTPPEPPSAPSSSRGGSCSTCRSYQSVKASSPHSWRLRVLPPGDVLVEQPRRPAAAGRSPGAEGSRATSVSRANGSSSPRSQAAAGIEKPRLRPCTTSRGSSGSTALRSSTFFARPRTLRRVGSAKARFVTSGSRNGTRASSECAIEARSVFTSRSSTR